MRVTIIPADKAVYVEGQAVLGLNLVGVPGSVHALQWKGSDGWIEYNTGASNEAISELPTWALAAVESRTQRIAAELAAAEAAANTPPTAQQIQDTIVAATQQRLDTFARTRNYDGILSACTYVGSSVPRFAADGATAVAARDATWDALYAVLAEVLAETRPMPSSFADVEPLLPSLGWPL